VTLDISHFAAASSAQAWQLTAANAITRLPNVSIRKGHLETSVPAQSITLFVVPAAH
jgi:hypothetical protein